jgi:DNA-binding transcriptional ArsR family regulator
MPNERILQVARAVGDPVRVAILERLLDGPATVAELVAGIGATQPNVSNHLAVLRGADLVRAARNGRTAVYRLRGREVRALLRSLMRAAGVGDRRPLPPHPLAVARSCYDHAAGLLGVEILDGLVRRGALRSPHGGRGDVGLGPRLDRMFAALGVDPAATKRSRRFAFECLDWTERRPHLGGALGSAVLARLLEAGWVVRMPGTRALEVTAGGRRALRRKLGVRLDVRGPEVRSLS